MTIEVLTLCNCRYPRENSREQFYHLYIVPDTAKRLLYLRIAIVAGAFLGMALSYKLWLTARFFPLTPVFPFLKPVSAPFDAVLFGAALVGLAACAMTARLIPIFATLAIVLVLFDQSRMQPWLYEYVFLLLGVAFASPNACRLIIASTYFWSGIQKLNTAFIDDAFPQMLEPMMRHLPHAAQALVHPISQAAPFIELAIGLALLARKFRTYAVIAAVAMHAFILIALGTWGQDYSQVIWPWNIAMAAAVVILFWKTNESVRQILEAKGAFHVAVLLLFCVAPVLSFYGYWDHFLTGAMYTSNRDRATIFITDKLADRLPREIIDYVRIETPELDSIDISEWSAGELHVPPYPELRIYKSIARKMCGYTTDPTEVRLSITTKSTVGHNITGSSFSCTALNR
jgi:hypothetical protein